MTRRWIVLLCTSLLAMVWPAFAYPSSTPEHVRLQLKWHHQFQFAGYYAALQQGYYRDEGLDVEIIEGGQSIDPLQQVLNGKADYAIGDSEILISRLSGKPVVALAAIFQHSPYVLLSLQKSGIKRPEDLIGKRIMLSGEHGRLQFQAMLLQHHLDIQKMTILPYQSGLDDLIEGRVDAVMAYATDEPMQLRQRGYIPAILSNQAYGADFYGDVLFTTEQVLSQHPAQAEAFLRATKKGWKYAFNHQDAMAHSIAKMPGVVQRDIQAQTLLQEAQLMAPYVLSEIVPWGHMNEERWQGIAQTYAALGLVPADFQLKGFVYHDDVSIERPYVNWLIRGVFSLVLVVTFTMLWNLQMRRQVAERTRALQDEIDQRRQTEYLLKVAGNVAKIGGWVIDLPSQRMRWSDEVAALHELPPGSSPSLEEGMQLFMPAYRELMTTALQKCMQEGIPYDLELEKRTVNGRRFWVRAMGQAVRDPQGQIIQVQGSLQDITAQKQLEAIKQGQEKIQAMLLADVPLQAILHAAVQLIEAHFSEVFCVILQMDQDGRHLHHAASHRLPDSYAKAMNHLPVAGHGMLSLTQHRVIAEEISSHPLWADYAALALKHGLRACWSMPIVSRSHRVLGMLAMYRQLPHVPQPAELDLVESYAHILGLAIEREQSDEQLKLLQNGVSRLNDVVMITEAPVQTPLQQKIVFLNEAFTRITGLAVEPFNHLSPFELFKNSTPASDLQRIKQAWQQQLPIKTEVVTVDQHGNGLSLEMDALPLHDKSGRVTHWVAVLRDVSERKRADAQIRQLAYYDTMTGLPNRLLLQDRLVAHIRKAQQKKTGGALMFIDIDNFKTLNDTHGHAVGDALLIEVAKRIKQSVRRQDTVSRLGGDEFVVVLDSLAADVEHAEKQARNICEKIVNAFKKPFKLDHYQHYTTPSIGIVLFDAAYASQTDELLRRADMAMYKAKEAGRNGYQFFDTQMETELRQRVALEAELHEAMQKQEFILHLQPQYNQQHQVVGAEALLRWQHPERGLIMPGEFIAIAESTGQIVALGRWVLQQACALLQQWAFHPQLSQMVLAVNVSPKQYLQSGFVAEVQQLVAQANIAPGRLKLELTESMLIDNVEDIIAKMNVLKAAGICFSLDDFGTGYSSLSYLKRFPFDQLKIDQSFVRDMLQGQDHQSIVNAIISLGISLQLDVLAEGVETEAQLDLLTRLGCNTFQGYYFSVPQRTQDFERLVATGRSVMTG
ncbi:EAL domain-containing protein [Methylophilus sp. 3sh_L]|uniref:EAL domain-containing protein n=1 Tax=Methylophilus sp. 3sh_L TaxID=3377114 RepID=UPI00398E69BC